MLVRGSLVLAAATPLGLLGRAAVSSAAASQGKCALGAFANADNVALTFARSQREIEQVEALLGRRLGIASTFVAWEEPFPNAGHELDRAAGRTPLIAWDGRRDLAAIRSGRWDRCSCAGPGRAGTSARRSTCAGHPSSTASGILATGAAASSSPRGGTWSTCSAAPARPTCAGSGARSRARQRYRAAEDWRAYYPGDRFVDRVGMDGYNWGSARSWSRWQSFDAIFGPLYADYARRKPMMICEVACGRARRRQGAWIRDMGASLGTALLEGPSRRLVPREQGNRLAHQLVGSALRAFRAVVADRPVRRSLCSRAKTTKRCAAE